jgi:hypothetical protein
VVVPANKEAAVAAVPVRQAVAPVMAVMALLLHILARLLLMLVAAVGVETHQPRFLVDLVAVAVLVCSFPQVLSSHRAETVVLVL